MRYNAKYEIEKKKKKGKGWLKTLIDEEHLI